MRLSEGVEWGLHCCTVLAALPPGTAMPASRLAEFHGVPTAYLAKHLQALAGSGILESVPGARGGYRLARPVTEITLLDVVEALDGREHVFRCTEIRMRGPASLPASHYKAACSITRAMRRAEDAWRESLRSQTIADLLAELATSIHPKSLAKAADWFQEVVR
jgi:Rrf2 family protein